MGKFYNIDPNTCSKEELEAAITNCAKQEDIYHTLEQSTKVFINSVYGAMASPYYVCSNIDIAESITLQGQDLIKYSVKQVDHYFGDVWSTDYETHDKIALYMKQRHPNFDIDGFKERCKQRIMLGSKGLQIYGDTDSAYISLQPVIEALNISIEQETDFVLAINACVLEKYLAGCFDEYAASFNCPENREKFELEKIARTVLMLAKKKYVMDISWTEGGAEGIKLAPLHKMVYKGIEVIQGSTPEFCRTMMKDFIRFVIDYANKNEKPTYDVIVRELKSMKAKFAMQSPNAVCKSFGLSDYEKYVHNDKVGYAEIQYVPGVTCPIHVRAAAVYNNTLYCHPKAKRYKSKYNFIKKGDKVKFYFINKDEVFGFLPDEFPVEFAPPMDIDIQFEKMILDPMNRIVESIGYPAVPVSLAYSSGLW